MDFPSASINPGPASQSLPPFATYLFDLDGTLIDTNELILACFQDTLAAVHGIKPPTALIESLIGLPLLDQYRALIPALGLNEAADLDVLMQHHMQYQLSVWRDHIKVFPGAVETLRALRGRGARLAIVTSRRQETTQLYLREFGLRPYLDVICTPECTTHHKPHPEPARWALAQLGADPSTCLFVGDAVFDMECGRGAGCKTAMVAWGYEKNHQALLQAPDYVIASLPALLG